jgi:hypothetical protein
MLGAGFQYLRLFLAKVEICEYFYLKKDPFPVARKGDLVHFNKVQDVV